jgi:flagellar biogenesis protein FliO
MNNIFRTESPSGRPSGKAMLKRAGFFAAGLVLLWLAVELMPTPSTSAPVVQESDEGVLAYGQASSTTPIRPGMVFAVLILVGGGIFAVVLRKRSTDGGTSGPLETLADMPITPDQRLRLIRCGDDVMLLGITAGGVNVLEKYRADAFDASGDGAPGLSPAFADLLREAAGRYRPSHKGMN